MMIWKYSIERTARVGRSSSSSSSSLLFVLLVLLSNKDCNFVCLAQQQTGGSSVCTLCADGSTPSGTYPDGLECAVVANIIGETPGDSDVCREAQITAVQYCSCATLPDGLCPLCTDGATLEFPDLRLPDRNATCRSIAFPTECQTGTYNAAWYCGCTNSIGTARPIAGAAICSQDDTILMHTNRILPNDLATTCLQYDRTLGVLSNTAGLGVDPSPIGDLPAYCGCADALNVPIPKTCSLCDGGELSNPNRIVVAGTSTACIQLQTLADYVTNESYCSTMKQTYSTACCQATSAPVTPAPAPPTPVAGPQPVATTNATIPVAAPVTSPPVVPNGQDGKASAATAMHGRTVDATLQIGGLILFLMYR